MHDTFENYNCIHREMRHHGLSLEPTLDWEVFMTFYSEVVASRSCARCWDLQIFAHGEEDGRIGCFGKTCEKGYPDINSETQQSHQTRPCSYLSSVSKHMKPPIRSQERDVLIAQVRERNLVVIAG